MTTTAQSAVSLSQPRAREDVSVHEIDGEALVFDPSTGDTHHLNETAFLVWRRCDGRRTAGEIASELAARFNITEVEAREHVDRIVEEFRLRQLISQPSEKDESP